MSDVTARPKAGLVEKIGKLASKTGSTSDELALAVEAYRDLEHWHLAAIDAAIAEDDGDAPGIADDRVARWLESWGTPDESPPPTS